ncbi:MAG TPA: sulfate adenylyltransferase, partial [Chloroflexota bacterium]|nr:sulfate adenylyltransferase [Chloroflexota bacterium]
VPDVTCIPVSALNGDNVVHRSDKMPWYEGVPLLYHLEHVHIASDRNLIDMRFPVQLVIRPFSDEHHDYRGYAGQLAGGVMKPGDDVLALPSGFQTRIKAVDAFGRALAQAFPPMSVIVRLEDDIDVSRGDMLCRPHNQPSMGQDLEVMLCWLSETPLNVGGRYALKHTTRGARALIKELRYKLNVNTLHRDETAGTLTLNEIGRASLRTTVPLFYDQYRRNRTTGSLILIDEATNNTVAAAMIL